MNKIVLASLILAIFAVSVLEETDFRTAFDFAVRELATLIAA